MTYPAQLWPAQQTFLQPNPEHPIDIAVFTGERGCGKTFAATLLGLKLALATPNTIGLVIVPSKGFFWDVLEPLILQHLKGLQIKDARFSSTRMRLKLANGSEIRFRSIRQADRPTSVHWVHVADIHSLNEEEYVALFNVLRAPGQRHRLFTEAQRPFLPGSWQHRHFEAAKPSPVKSLRVIRGTAKENKALPAWQHDPTLRPKHTLLAQPAVSNDQLEALLTELLQPFQTHSPKPNRSSAPRRDSA